MWLDFIFNLLSTLYVIQGVFSQCNREVMLGDIVDPTCQAELRFSFWVRARIGTHCTAAQEFPWLVRKSSLWVLFYVLGKKGKVVPGHTMKRIQGVGVYLHQFLTSTLDGDE